MPDLQRLRNVFRSSLDLSPDEPVDELSYPTDRWDSLAHMSLVATIEDEFSVMLDTDDVINLSSFTEAVRILDKYGVELHD